MNPANGINTRTIEIIPIIKEAVALVFVTFFITPRLFILSLLNLFSKWSVPCIEIFYTMNLPNLSISYVSVFYVRLFRIFKSLIMALLFLDSRYPQRFETKHDNNREIWSFILGRTVLRVFLYGNEILLQGKCHIY